MEKQVQKPRKSALIQFLVTEEDRERGEKLIGTYGTLAAFARHSYLKELESAERQQQSELEAKAS
jgi:hypothetical protein